jgi:RNA polymerase sigma-B factor
MAKAPLAAKLDMSANQALIKQHMPLVNQIARHYSRFRPDMQDDLVQVGSIGLLKAIKYYDPSRSRAASLRTLASCYIRGEIRHYLRDHACLVQVPRRLNEINSRVAQVEEVLARELQHAPTVQEIAQRSGFTEQEICEAQRSWDSCAHYESLEAVDDRDEHDDGRALSEMVADRKYQDFVLASEDRELLRQAVTRLGNTARQIVEFVYFYDLTQKETAQKLGISEMGVSRTLNSALRSLKDMLCTEIF